MTRREALLLSAGSLLGWAAARVGWNVAVELVAAESVCPTDAPDKALDDFTPAHDAYHVEWQTLDLWPKVGRERWVDPSGWRG